MSVHLPLNNPGPVDDICQDNAHRVGAPNHHQHSGSGEAPMVGTTQTSGYVPAETVKFVRARLSGQTHRYLTAGRGGLTVHVEHLADLVAEIATEYAEHVGRA